MSKRQNVSTGLLLFRRIQDGCQFFIAHLGGPFWAKREAGAWTIPKGEPKADEELLATACREFEEETGIRPHGPYLELGCVQQKAGKVVHAWAWEGDADPDKVTSNLTRMEWPRGSGNWMTFPEVDRCAWFDPKAAREKINSAQATFIDRLEALIAARG